MRKHADRRDVTAVYCTAIATVLLVVLPSVKNTGTALPVGVPAGTVTFNWYSPTD